MSALSLAGAGLPQFLKGQATPAAIAFNYRDKTLIAEYESFDSTGCLVTDVLVIGTVERVKQSQIGNTVYPSASVLVSVFNICTFESPAFITGSTNDFQMYINQALSSATLIASIPCVNQSTNGTLTIDISLQLTATGPVSESRDRSRTLADGTLIIDRSVGSSRPASVTGSVVNFGLNYIVDPNGWFDSEIDALTGGLITVTPRG